MNERSPMHAIPLLRRVLACALVSLAMLAPRAHAQHIEPPLPIRPSLDWVTSALVDTGVRMPPEQMLSGFSKYMDEYLVAYTALDDSYAQMQRTSKLTPDQYLGPRDIMRINEIEAESTRTEIRLLDELFACFAASAPPEQADRLQLARQVLEIDVAMARAGYGVIDLGYWVRSGTGSGRGMRTGFAYNDGRVTDSDYEASAQRVRLIRTVHAAERADAYRKMASAMATRRVELAKAVERLGIVGQSFEAAQKTLAAREASPGEMDALTDSFIPRPQQTMPEWVALVKVQMGAYRAIESQLTEAQRTRLLQEGWLSELVSARGLPATLNLVSDNRFGQHKSSPREIVSVLLRANGLSDERKQRLRELGRKWISDSQALLLQEVSAALATGAFAKPDSGLTEMGRARLTEISRAIEMPDIVDEFKMIPTSAFAGELSAADAAEFGAYLVEPAAQDMPPKPRSGDALLARNRALPAEYSDELVGRLHASLGLTDDQRMVLEALTKDARARWASDVVPLTKAMEDRRSIRFNTPKAEQPEIRKAREAGFEAATKAIAAAQACDDAYFAAVQAALGSDGNRDMLRVAALARKTSTAAGVNLLEMGQARLADLPSAVVESNLSREGRRAAAAIVAASAEQWLPLVDGVRDTKRLYNKLNACGDISSGSGGGEWQASNKDPELNKVIAAMRAQMQASTDGWLALELATMARVLDALSGPDATAWHAAIRRQRWPDCYVLSTAAREDVERAIGEDEDAHAHRLLITATFDDAEPFLQLVGDAAAQICEEAAKLPKREDREAWAGNGAFQRMQALKELANARLQVAQALVRARTPAEISRKIPADVPIDRLSAVPIAD